MEEDGYHPLDAIYIDGQWFFNKQDLSYYDFNDDILEEMFKKVIGRGEDLYSFSKSIPNNLSSLGDKELFLLIDSLFKKLSSYMRIVDMPVYASGFFEEKLVGYMENEGFTGHDFDVLTHPMFNTFHQKRKKDLLLVKIGTMTQEEFINKWKWSEMILFQKKIVDSHFIEEQLSNISNPEKELIELDKNYEKAKEEYDSLYSKLPVHLKKKSDIVQKFLHVRDYRFELYIRSSFNSIHLFDEAARRMGITYQQFVYMTPDEILTKKIPSSISERIEGYVFFGGQIYTGEDINRWRMHFNTSCVADSVSGKGVSKGTVIGKVKIAVSKDDLWKIEKDDIIVCDITTPDYMHALHKVKGIVANIGGFTSHSAIVAREFGIPCVVGCGNATLIFKDGDMIEVDANKGIVRRIR
jgi:phosphohistidine swiveling domain-containing protein